jgi:hypothetical protein
MANVVTILVLSVIFLMMRMQNLFAQNSEKIINTKKIDYCSI